MAPPTVDAHPGTSSVVYTLVDEHVTMANGSFV